MRTKMNYALGAISTALVALLFAGCAPKDITYDHELPQFDIRSNAILLELIVPAGTASDDEIYVFGAFNGENETSAKDKLAWKMEKAAQSDMKWGIYLFPEDFVPGKTLADGFSFVSKKSGGERDVNGKPVEHKLDVTVGTRTNVWVDRWAAYFSSEDQPVEHDGFVIYVLDESGFSDLYLYMYGDVNDLNGAWPGMKPNGVENVNGVEYKYFDMGADNNGLNETLIFSDNGNNQLKDFGPVTFEGDNLFLHIKDDGTVEKIDASSTIEHDGPVVYVLDGKGWGMATTLYMWGDVNDLNGGWPGMTVDGTAKIGDYTYLYYDLGEKNVGLNESLIFSNNGATQLGDYPGNNEMWTIGEDLYLYISSDGVTVITDPENPGDLEWFDPTAAPREEATIDLWFYDSSDTLRFVVDSVSGDTTYCTPHVYAWGSSEIFGGWPGQSVTDMDSLAILGLQLRHTSVSCFVGDEFHLIVNNGNHGIQLPDYSVKAETTKNEFYLKITDAGLAPLEITAKNVKL